MMFKELTIADADEGIRLDRWFKRNLPGFPHGLLEKQLRKGLIRVDGKKAKTSDRVLPGQVVKIPEVELQPRAKHQRTMLSDSERSDVQKWVLYKDEQVIVINKPYGLPVQGGTKVNKSLDDLLDALCFDGERPKLVHRLDRDTSGALLLARNARAAAGLAKKFSGKDIEKIYWALVNGCPMEFKGTIDLPLSKSANDDNPRELVRVDHEEGKYAETEYRVKDALARKFALMELKPLTGRTHQLRVHMQAIGHPILGDHKYGGSNESAANLGVENILHLHARRIVVPMGKGKVLDVTAPLPKHMKKTFQALGLDVPKK